MSEPRFTVTAFGGVGEVGRNCFCYKYGKYTILVDCGSKILRHDDPNRDDPDFSMPNLSLVKSGEVRPLACFLTHGHRDHVGAIPELSRYSPRTEIYGTPATKNFYRLHFGVDFDEEDVIRFRAKTRALTDDETVNVGPFEVTAARVAHSIPGAVAFRIKAGGASAVHLGDAKFIGRLPIPPVMTHTYRGLQKFRENTVNLLVMDVVNAGIPGFTPSEHYAICGLEEILRESRGRVIIAQFATNAWRLQKIVEKAREMGKTIGFTGRAMRLTAQMLGLSDNHWPLRRPEALPYDGEVVFTTGSQAEHDPKTGRDSPLWRAAMDDGTDERPRLRLSPRDTVVLSSRAIPHNISDVKLMVARIRDTGARVILHDGESKKLGFTTPMEERFVHVSGHGSTDDLRLFYNLLQPRKVLAHHAEPPTLAKLPGVLPEGANIVFPNVLEEVEIG